MRVCLCQTEIKHLAYRSLKLKLFSFLSSYFFPFFPTILILLSGYSLFGSFFLQFLLIVNSSPPTSETKLGKLRNQQ